MLSPFDDYPIHPSADPIAHPATGDPNHYDRYWFNGVDRDGRFFLGGAMGHYPVRGVIDAAFSVVIDGVEHSIFASGHMPLDRATEVGPISIEILEPMRTLRLRVDPSLNGIGCDLVFRAKTIAIEEPRQRLIGPDGVQIMDHTRLTQWGTWEGMVWVDGTELLVDPATTMATRDRSWGVRGVGTPVPTQRAQRAPQVFWLWAPLHFEDMCTHIALHERTDGTRWVEAALILPLLSGDDKAYGTDTAQHCHAMTYELDFEQGKRQARGAVFHMTDPAGNRHRLELETLYTFRMRGIGYSHPHWSHGSMHGQLEVGRESIALADFDPLDISSIHIQNIVRARLGDRVGIGVLEQFHLGPHEPTGLTGFLDGYGT
jgi:hypothetical protein